MFMGINQVAYELLVENPMTGYMNEIIFSRILGHEDIEQGAYWVDGTQCWLCQKWAKATIQWNLQDDKMIFAQKVQKLETFHQNILSTVAKHFDKGDEQIEAVSPE